MPVHKKCSAFSSKSGRSAAAAGEREPSAKHEWIIQEYLRLWILASEAELDISKKQNTGRRAANSWLLTAGFYDPANDQSGIEQTARNRALAVKHSLSLTTSLMK